MNTSLRDLQRTVDAVETPDFDVDGIVAQGDRRLRWRQLALAAGGVALTVAVVIAGAQVTALWDRTGEPVRPAPSDPTPPPGEDLVIPDGQVTVVPEIRASDISGWTLSGDWTNEGANQLTATIDVENPDHAWPAWSCQGDPEMQVIVQYGEPGNQVTAMTPCDGENAGSPGGPEGWLSPSGYYYGGDGERWTVRMVAIAGMPAEQWDCFQTGVRTDCETAYPPLEPAVSDDIEFGFKLWEHQAPYIAGLFGDGNPGAWRHLPLNHVFEALSMYDGTEYVFDRIVYAAPGASTLAVHLDDLDQSRLVGAFQIATPAEDRCAARLGLGDTNQERFGNHEQIVTACAPVLQISVDGEVAEPRGVLKNMTEWGGSTRALAPPGAHDLTVDVVENDPANARFAVVIWRVRE